MDYRVPGTNIGVVSAGYFIPEGIISSADMARESGIPLDILTEKFGIDYKHIAPADEHPSSMGLKAAENALVAGNIEPDEIDLIAYCGSGYYDYQFWSPAASIQHSLGACNAFAFDIKNACNGGNLGIRVAAMLLAGDPSKKTALVVCSDKLSPVLDYQNKDNLPFFALADGASAAVLMKGEPTNTLLSYAGITDGTLDDYVRVSFGGTRTLANRGHPHDQRHFSVDPAKALADILPEVFLGNFIEVIRRAVVQSGYEPGQIRWLLTNQIKKTRVLDILHTFGLDEANTRFTMRNYGSIGPGDTLFSLALQLEENLIKPGDLVVLASSGIGFSWGAQVIKYSG
ncbi:MAG TPA: 3-oxoacyl-[acyl-carrier-protein] synthase III C-terminal domain-containing protein [Methanoregulaceae archaeon]|nr:3-oxoacyl-[acyl-carrier-protein] synthase III C-terminal domain-containing protein [Methanoregulaceae archaeon]